MLTARDRVEFQTVVERLARGSVAREDWATIAALVLLSQPDVVLASIAAEGFDEFLRVSRPVYTGHGFKYDDFKRIFDRVCAAVPDGVQAAG